MMSKLVQLCFFLMFIGRSINADETLSNDQNDEIQQLIPQNKAEKLAKCYDDNLNLKFERLDRNNQMFEGLLTTIIREEPALVQNMTRYFRLLRQTQLDMGADLNELKTTFKYLNILNELFKKDMLKIADNITALFEKQQSDMELLLHGKSKTKNETLIVDTREYDENLNCLKKCNPAKEKLPKSCAEIAVKHHFQDDAYPLQLDGLLKPFYAYCIYESKNENPWTIIQRREDGSQNFHRNWRDYKQGFGDVYGEYWLGLERMHEMTKERPHELWILLLDSHGRKLFKKYSNFSIAGEDEGYRMTFDFLQGNDFDPFAEHNNQTFATHDKDKGNCAKNFGSGWWYKGCFNCNLNGVYRGEPDYKIYDGIKWSSSLPGSMKYAHMAIRAL